MGTSLFREWAAKQPWWLPGSADHPSIILASKVSMARNLRGLRFPPFGGDSAVAERACYLVKELLSSSGVLVDTLELEPRALLPEQRQFLVERGLLRLEYVNSAADSLAFVSLDERRVLVINDTDHLRVNLMGDGLAVLPLVERLSEMDRSLSLRADFAMDDEFGHVCAQANEIGTGVVISVLLHLPAMKLRGYMAAASRAAELMGLKLTPLFERKDDAEAGLYQLRNLRTLGWSDMLAAERVRQLAMRLSWHENNAREVLRSRYSRQLCDSVGRARGILRGARVLSAPEARDLLSRLWLGSECGLLRQFPSSQPLVRAMGLLGDCTLANLVAYDRAGVDKAGLRSHWLRQTLEWL